MLLRPEKMKKKIDFLNYKYTHKLSVFPVFSSSQVVLGKTAVGKLLCGLRIGS